MIDDLSCDLWFWTICVSAWFPCCLAIGYFYDQHLDFNFALDTSPPAANPFLPVPASEYVCANLSLYVQSWLGFLNDVIVALQPPWDSTSVVSPASAPGISATSIFSISHLIDWQIAFLPIELRCCMCWLAHLFLGECFMALTFPVGRAY